MKDISAEVYKYAGSSLRRLLIFFATSLTLDQLFERRLSSFRGDTWGLDTLLPYLYDNLWQGRQQNWFTAWPI